jgi:hypothetical protein
VSEAKRLKPLEDENAKLKKLLAEQMLDAAALDFVHDQLACGRRLRIPRRASMRSKRGAPPPLTAILRTTYSPSLMVPTRYDKTAIWASNGQTEWRSPTRISSISSW